MYARAATSADIGCQGPKQINKHKCINHPNRGCGLMHKSGTNLDWDLGPPGGADGCVKSPTPI